MTRGVFVDITGRKFGRLTAVRHLGYGKWLCRCSCGNETVTNGGNLRLGITKSCGCLHSDTSRKRHTKHGHLAHRGKVPKLYGIWTRTRKKCRDQSYKSYKSFGGNGIDICDEWFDDYDTFYKWAVSSGYDTSEESNSYRLLRYDESGNYEPDNCYWGDSRETSRDINKCAAAKQSQQEEPVDAPGEIWRPIAGYEGLYEVSNYGNVRSLTLRNGSGTFARKKLVVQGDNGHGYKYVSFHLDGKRKNHYVHRLVADAFVPNPNNLPVVDHIDFDRANNRADNLQWTTQKQNVVRSIPHMSKPRKKAMTNTGERYVSKLKTNGMYRVAVAGKTIGTYTTLEDAVSARDTVLREG